jgi:flagellar hook-associated protein 2
MMVQQSLLSDASYSISGNSGYTGLSSVGVSTNEDGTLTFDSSSFTTALQADPTAVRNLFQQFSPTYGVAQNFANDLTNITDPTNGPLAIDQNSIAQNQTDLTQQISDFQANLATQKQQLIMQYSQVNATLQEMPITLNQISSQLSKIG